VANYKLKSRSPNFGRTFRSVENAASTVVRVTTIYLAEWISDKHPLSRGGSIILYVCVHVCVYIVKVWRENVRRPLVRRAQVFPATSSIRYILQSCSRISPAFNRSYFVIEKNLILSFSFLSLSLSLSLFIRFSRYVVEQCCRIKIQSSEIWWRKFAHSLSSPLPSPFALSFRVISLSYPDIRKNWTLPPSHVRNEESAGDTTFSAVIPPSSSVPSSKYSENWNITAAEEANV
jgi:hypothetical protein